MGAWIHMLRCLAGAAVRGGCLVLPGFQDGGLAIPTGHTQVAQIAGPKVGLKQHPDVMQRCAEIRG